MSAEKIKIFNSIIESFLSQTTNVVGTTYYSYFKKIIKVNALMPIENGITQLLPFKDRIFDKDESYFKNEQNYADKINIPMAQVSNDTIISEIFKLKNIYEKLDDESKSNVWDILQALVQLCIEYCELKNIAIEC